MAQAREHPSYHPSSPRSSPGGADSYKHEGTPDTRLTAFSPEENSARSVKLLRTFSLTASEPSPVRFSSASIETYHAGSSSPHVEKDPFVSTVNSRTKAEQKLSPTASAFRPFCSAVVAHGSAQAQHGRDETSAVAGNDLAGISHSLSTELGVSRCLAISSPSRAVTESDVETYLTVCVARIFKPSSAR